MGPVPLDMSDGGIQPFDHLGGNHGVEIFRGPVFLGRRLDARIDRTGCFVAAYLAARVKQHGDERSKMRRRSRRIDKERLGGAAHAGAPHLGIEDDRLCHADLCRPVHIDVTDALEMGKYRHTRFLLHARNQALAAARHNDVDSTVKTGEHHSDRRALARRHQLDRCFR